MGFRVGAATGFFHHLFAKHLGQGLPAEAFSRRVVELVADLLQLRVSHRCDVARAWQPPADAPVRVLDGAFLPGRGGVAEPGLGAELGL